MENPNKLTKNQELISDYNKVIRCKVNIQKSISFIPAMNNSNLKVKHNTIYINIKKIFRYTSNKIHVGAICRKLSNADEKNF